MAVITPERERTGRGAPGEPLPLPLPRPRGSGRRGAGPVVAAVVVVVALVFGLGRLGDLLPDLRNPFATETVDRTQPAVLKALEDLNEYKAASGNYQVIVDLERDARYLPSVVKGERTLFVGVGSVDAGVDFSGLGPEAVVVSADRRAVTVTLPPARLSEARVDPGRSYVYERQRGLLDRIGSALSDNPSSERELYILTEQRLEAAAAEGSDLVDRAEQNTRAMLEGLLRSLGFTAVDVRFG